MGKAKDGWGRSVLIARSLPIISSYEGVPMTVRQLYYRLVSIGMPNTDQHYKRVVSAMGVARWKGIVNWDAFVDRERSMEGMTLSDVKDLDEEIKKGKQAIDAQLDSHYLHPWSNQPKYVEVFIEKKALQGVFERPCRKMTVALGPCKGYPSLTYLDQARQRFEEADDRGQDVVMLYFGDYDPSGVDIPRSILDNLIKMENWYELDVNVIALHPHQIEEMNLPPAPVKRTDSRAVGWQGGVVELDAVEPRTLQKMCLNAIREHFDFKLYKELMEEEERQRPIYREALMEHIRDLAKKGPDEDEDKEGK